MGKEETPPSYDSEGHVQPGADTRKPKDGAEKPEPAGPPDLTIRLVTARDEPPKPSDSMLWKVVALPLTATVVTAGLGYAATRINADIQQAQINRDYVKIAVDVLSHPQASASAASEQQALRGWAVGVINKLAPEKMDEPLQKGLTEGNVQLPTESFSEPPPPSAGSLAKAMGYCVADGSRVTGCKTNTLEECEKYRKERFGESTRCIPRPEHVYCYNFVGGPGASAVPSCFSDQAACESVRAKNLGRKDVSVSTCARIDLGDNDEP